MQTAALYIRVSTDDQVEYSPDAQKKSLLKYADDNHLFVDEQYIFVDEGLSGRQAEKRPAFMHMIATAKKRPRPFDVILVHKFDRFARNREDSVVYKSLLRKDCNVKVISITETLEDDKFSIILESMLEAMAEYYSLNLSDEVKKGMFEKASRGEHIGNLPFGYILKDKNLLPHPTEFPAVQKIFEMFVSGSSLLEIARYLNTHDIKTKNGKLWTKQPLRYLLRNHVYMGYTRYNYRAPKTNIINPKSAWILIKSAHKPAITDDIFEKAQTILKNNYVMNRTDTHSDQVKSWMQKLVTCKHCGSTLRILHVNRKGVRYNYFRCDKAYQGGCNMNNTYSAIKLNAIILEKLNVDLRIDHINITMIKSSNDINELNILNKKLAKLKRQNELIYKSYIGEIDSLEEYKKNKDNILQEEAEIFALIEKASKNKNAEILKTIQIENFKALLTHENVTENDKHKAARKFIEKIEVDLFKKNINLYYYI
ncbi:MAG: hypothetical protein CVU84_01665 [Firmicutes bacterium HGW-Firmicutes-1]|jgi:DNA invertase Pin-like site-specific DNA recombinase|nr:MAG: hypothetical protein CVU84_01665 [Firmicutes bacterium HGW-Firmicutes-1]